MERYRKGQSSQHHFQMLFIQTEHKANGKKRCFKKDYCTSVAQLLKETLKSPKQTAAPVNPERIDVQAVRVPADL